MSTHKIITIILVILAIFLGISIYLQNKVGQLIVPTDKVKVASSTTVLTSTPIKPSETFPKQITLSSANYYKFTDGATLSLKQVNDSRCAADVNCIWAGNIIAIFNIKKGNVNESFELKFGADAENSQFSHGEYKIKIMNVKPDRGMQSQVIDQHEYRVIVIISK